MATIGKGSFSDTDPLAYAHEQPFPTPTTSHPLVQGLIVRN